jgi:putative transcriptional regulator
LAVLWAVIFILPIHSTGRREVSNVLTKLKLIRLQLGLKQNQVATQLGIHKSYLNKIENNAANATDELLKELAKIYKCTVKELTN